MIARALVEEIGMGGATTGVRRYTAHEGRRDRRPSEAALAALDTAVNGLLEEQRLRANGILNENRELLLALRTLLLEKKSLDRAAFGALLPGPVNQRLAKKDKKEEAANA